MRSQNTRGYFACLPLYASTNVDKGAATTVLDNEDNDAHLGEIDNERLNSFSCSVFKVQNPIENLKIFFCGQ